MGYMSEIGVKHLENAIVNLKMLKSFSLIYGYHPNVTDESILSLVEVLRQLESLQCVELGFYACGKMTITGVKKMQELLNKKKDVSIELRPLRLW